MGQPTESVVLALASIQGFSRHELSLVMSSLTRRPPFTSRPWDEFATTMKPIADRQFTWPEFDRWQAFFAARDSFPVRWEGLRQAPPACTPEADDYQRRKLGLLFEWLEAIARRSAIVAHYARQGLATRIAQQDTRDACAVCSFYIARPAGADPEVMPPFHPGCRCILLAHHASGTVPRARQP
jgi:hypothetical protein